MGCSASTAEAVQAKTAENEQQCNFFQKYTLAGKLGKGGFAQVRALTSQGLAVKIQDLRSEGADGRLVQNARFRREVVEEATVWRAAGQHTNIVGLRDAFLEHGVCFFVMQRCDMSFQKFLTEGAGEMDLNERGLSRIFREVLGGLAHLHGRSIVHRDMKPDNLMVSSGVVQLCDFGLAAILPKEGGLSGTYGTAPFMAPEMLNRDAYATEVDVWSVGVIAYVLFYGTFPYLPQIKSSVEMKKVIREGATLPSFTANFKTSKNSTKGVPGVSKDAESFARLLLNREQKARVTAVAAAEQSFVLRPSAAELPALRPQLASAMKCGAFENRKIDKPDGELDILLERLHRKYEGGSRLPMQEEEPIKPTNSFAISDASTVDTKGNDGASDTTSGTGVDAGKWSTNNLSAGGRHTASELA